MKYGSIRHRALSLVDWRAQEADVEHWHRMFKLPWGACLRLGPPAGRGRRAKAAKQQDVVDPRILHWHLDAHFFLNFTMSYPPLEEEHSRVQIGTARWLG